MWKKYITSELDKLKTAVNKPLEKKAPNVFLKFVNKTIPQFSDAVALAYNP